MMNTRKYIVALSLLALLWLPGRAHAYIEVPYSLGRLVNESLYIIVLKVDKLDRDRNLIIFSKVKDLKAPTPHAVYRHNIGTGGFHPREWQIIMSEMEVGKIVVKFANKGASETYMGTYWYQCYNRGEWWTLVHSEPYLLRSYAGKMDELVEAVQKMVAGQEVVITAMVDGDKNALQLRSARLHKLRASLKLLDYNIPRDFVGWGADVFRPIRSMPGFSHEAELQSIGPGARGIAAADFNGDGHADFLLYGEEKTVLMANEGNSAETVPLPYTGGARAAAWGDVNGDGRPDLLLATPEGPKLLINDGQAFHDLSALLPKQPYYNLTAAAFIDFDGDGRPDILLANGFMGLKLYRNRGVAISTAPDAAGTEPLFEDVSASAGLGMWGAASSAKGDHLAVADVNGDGRPDVLYSAAGGIILINTPTGFVPARNTGLSFKTGNIAPIFAHLTGGRLPDLFVPQPDGCRIYRNNANGTFTDITAQAGDLAKFNGNASSAAFADFAGRGTPDLIIGCLNGPNRYFRNEGNGRFTEATAAFGLDGRLYNTRAMVAVDLNNDRVPDLVLNNLHHS
jgi:hypothetical protein